MPKESHDVDFSRIKPWYLDGQSVAPVFSYGVFVDAPSSAAYLRQTVLLSAHETPETRALFNHSLKNVSGRIRTERRWTPIEVPEGIDQVSPSAAISFTTETDLIAELRSIRRHQSQRRA